MLFLRLLALTLFLDWPLPAQLANPVATAPVSELESKAADLTNKWNVLNQEFQSQFEATGKFANAADTSVLKAVCGQFNGRYEAIRTAFKEMQSARKDYYASALTQAQADLDEVRHFAARTDGGNLNVQATLEQTRQDLAAYKQQRAELNKTGDSFETVRAQEILSKLIDQLEARITTLTDTVANAGKAAVSRDSAIAALTKRIDLFRDALAAIPRIDTAYDVFFLARFKRYRLNCLTVDTDLPCLAPPGKKCP